MSPLKIMIKMQGQYSMMQKFISIISIFKTLITGALIWPNIQFANISENSEPKNQIEKHFFSKKK